MDNQQLRERLEQLHTDLTHTVTVDANTRALLQTLIEDASALLASTDAVPVSHAQSVRQRLSAAIQQFEVSHPQLTWTLSQISDRLSRMGF